MPSAMPWRSGKPSLPLQERVLRDLTGTLLALGAEMLVQAEKANTPEEGRHLLKFGGHGEGSAR